MAGQLTSSEGPFRIGQVAELTGVSVHTLRTWERRYGLVNPSRTPGGLRTYSASEVERLRLVRHLTRTGVPVSLLVSLSLETLRERVVASLRSRGPAREDGTTAKDDFRIAIVHPSFSRLSAEQNVRWSASVAEAMEEGPAVLVVEDSLLGDDPSAQIAALQEASPGTRVVVLVAIAARQRLDALVGSGAVVVREPIRQAELLRLVRELAPSREASQRPAGRTLSRETLQRILDVRADSPCGCSEHLARIALSVDSFEQYARACAQATPEDAELHTDLAEAAAAIQSRLSALIERVCNHDGIRLDDRVA